MQIPRLLLKRIDQIPLESQAQGLAFFTMSPEVSWTVKLENQYFCFVLFCFWKRVFQSPSVILHWAWFLPWCCLETLLIVMTVEGFLYLVAWGQRHCSTSPSAQHSTPQQRMIWPQMSIGLRLRNPGLGSVVNTWRGLKSGCVTGWFLTLLRWGAGMGLWTSMSRYGAAKFSWNRAELTSTESIQMIGWKLLIHWFAKGFVFFFLPSDTNFFFFIELFSQNFCHFFGKKLCSACAGYFSFPSKRQSDLETILIKNWKAFLCIENTESKLWKFFFKEFTFKSQT